MYFDEICLWACLAIHREIFENVGLFDERLFLKLEETDFYHRATKVQYVSVCAPFVKIFHNESKSFGGKVTPGKTYYTLRNSLLLIEKSKTSIPNKLGQLKGIYWILSNTAARDSGNAMLKKEYTLINWLFSDPPYAIASRYGLLHHIARKFGRMPVNLSDRTGTRSTTPGPKPINT